MVKKTSKKKEIYDYLLGYIKSKDAEEIIKCSDIFNDKGFNLWSFKKLIFLQYYLKPYLAILLNMNIKCYFLDLFSGCGANEVEGLDVKSLGSPIISLLNGVYYNKSKKRNSRFDKWFFIDSNKEFCEALKKRVKKTINIIDKDINEKIVIDKDVKILCGNCNKEIKKVVDGLKRIAENNKIAVLAFIDPYKFSDIEWSTWEKLCSLRYVDVVFTFPIATVKRGIESCKDKEKYLPPSCIKLLEDSKSLKISSIEFEQLYAQDLVNMVQRSINYYSEGISVTNTINSELYRIELFTYSSSALKLTLGIAKRLNSITPLDLKSMVESVCGKTKSLMDFCK